MTEFRIGWGEWDVALKGGYNGPIMPHVEIVIQEVLTYGGPQRIDGNRFVATMGANAPDSVRRFGQQFIDLASEMEAMQDAEYLRIEAERGTNRGFHVRGDSLKCRKCGDETSWSRFGCEPRT